MREYVSVLGCVHVSIGTRPEAWHPWVLELQAVLSRLMWVQEQVTLLNSELPVQPNNVFPLLSL